MNSSADQNSVQSFTMSATPLTFAQDDLSSHEYRLEMIKDYFKQCMQMVQEGKCSICNEPASRANGKLFVCQSCYVHVHATCYGSELMQPIVAESGWMCQRCSYCFATLTMPNEIPADGAFKKLQNGSWAHAVCVDLIPEIYFVEDGLRETIKYVGTIPGKMYNKKCQFCKSTDGVLLECDEAVCSKSFHASCMVREELYVGASVMRGLKRVNDYKHYYPVYCKKHLNEAIKFSDKAIQIIKVQAGKRPHPEEEKKARESCCKGERWVAPWQRIKVKRDESNTVIHNVEEDKAVADNHPKHSLQIKVKAKQADVLKKIFDFVLTFQKAHADKSTTIALELE